MAKTLAVIEHAALGAYQKDLSGGPAAKAKLPLPVITDEEHAQQIQQYLAAEKQSAEREAEKKKIEENAQQKVQEIQTKALENAYQAYSSSYLIASAWHQCLTPEGFVYFYNSRTGGIPELYRLNWLLYIIYI